MDTREFVALIRDCQADPGSSQSGNAFATLWATVRPLIERELERTSTLGPFAALKHHRMACMQDVAAKFFEKLPRFLEYWQERHKAGQEPPQVEPWLRTVIRRQAIDWVRKQPGVVRRKNPDESYTNRLDREQDVDTLLTSAAASGPVDTTVRRLRVAQIVAWARANLSEDERLALLEYLMTDIPQSKPVRRALEKLRRQFRPENEE